MVRYNYPQEGDFPCAEISKRVQSSQSAAQFKRKERNLMGDNEEVSTETTTVETTTDETAATTEVPVEGEAADATADEPAAAAEGTDEEA